MDTQIVAVYCLCNDLLKAHNHVELVFLEQRQRLVTAVPHNMIERHFAWVKHYFGLKYFECIILLRVMQFVQLIYIVAQAVQGY